MTDHRLSPATKREHLTTTQTALVGLKMFQTVLLPSTLLQEILPGKHKCLGVIVVQLIPWVQSSKVRRLLYPSLIERNPELFQSTSTPHNLSKIQVYVNLCLLRLPCGSFPGSFPTKICMQSLSPMS